MNLWPAVPSNYPVNTAGCKYQFKVWKLSIKDNRKTWYEMTKKENADLAENGSQSVSQSVRLHYWPGGGGPAEERVNLSGGREDGRGGWMEDESSAPPKSDSPPNPSPAPSPSFSSSSARRLCSSCQSSSGRKVKSGFVLWQWFICAVIYQKILQADELFFGVKLFKIVSKVDSLDHSGSVVCL